ncbi:hypothetical protein [Streptomyces sp. SP17KL33]|uniref:hypothetical protein n=1 Tax=Streptomyces sp. SP17KL33 TaxID=3002534 RepID=UPI002E790643|nr:hypothetical protein [Streptomyces sp. SP17KL33]MEE1834962.1 hypothetical protein [Streptomyces sp. SP17KL33]
MAGAQLLRHIDGTQLPGELLGGLHRVEVLHTDLCAYGVVRDQRVDLGRKMVVSRRRKGEPDVLLADVGVREETGQFVLAQHRVDADVSRESDDRALGGLRIPL